MRGCFRNNGERRTRGESPLPGLLRNPTSPRKRGEVKRNEPLQLTCYAVGVPCFHWPPAIFAAAITARVRLATPSFCRDHRPSAKHAWTSPASLIGNLCCHPRAARFIFESVALIDVPTMEPASSSADPDWGVFKYAVTLGVRCCHLSWVNWVRASRRVRPAPPRLVRRRSLLRGQIFGVRRRNMGTKPRGQRC